MISNSIKFGLVASVLIVAAGVVLYLMAREYDPADYHRLLRTREERGADAVYGSRFAGGRPDMTLSHRIGNQLLTGVLRSLRGLGIESGRDLALISCDDVPLSELHTPPITVIDRDIEEFGRAGARLALERLSDPDAPPRKMVLPTSLMLRESTVRVPTD